MFPACKELSMLGRLKKIFSPKVELPHAESYTLSAKLSFESSKWDQELLTSIAEGISTQQELGLPLFQEYTRFIGGLEENSFHAVAREMTHMQHYLQLKKLFQKEGFYYTIKEDLAEEFTIPALLWMPLLLNACRHGIATIEKYPIRIQVRTTAQAATFTISNRVNHYVHDQSANSLIDLLRERLQNHFPTNHSLLINSNSNIFKVTLTIFKPC